MNDKTMSKAFKNSQKESSFYVHLTYPGVSGFFHFGHFRGYTYCDVLSRYHRLLGDRVLFTAGVHASGNPVFVLLKRILNEDSRLKQEFIEHGYTNKDFESLTTPEKIISFFKSEYKKTMEIDVHRM